MADPIRCAYSPQDLEPFYIGATSAAFSRDGSLLATPLNEDVVVTELSSNSILHKLEGDGELVTALAMSPDGRFLAVVSQSQQLRIYNVASGELTKLHRLSAPAYIAAADETSTLFAFGATDGVVTVWDIEGGYVTHLLKGHGTTICALAFHGELHLARWMLALGDTMGTCKVWNLVSRKCVATTSEHAGAVRGVAFSADGEHFATGGRDEVVVVYRTSNLKRAVHTFAVRHQVEKCGFTAVRGRPCFYTAGLGCRLRVWDIDTGAPVAATPAPLETQEELVVVDVAETDEAFWLVLSDQMLVEVPRPDAETEWEQAATGELQLAVARRIAGNHGTVADIRYAGPGLSLVAMATNAPALRIVDPLAPLDVQLLEGHTDLLNCVDASEDGMWLLSGSKDGDARLWHYTDGQFEPYAVFSGHAGSVTACALPKHIEGVPRFVVTASTDLTVKKWKVAAGAVKASEYTRRAHDKEINAVAVSPNDELFATASFDKTAKVWDVAHGETVGVLKGHKRGVWDVHFCQYDKLVATAAGDKTAKVWLVGDYRCVGTFEGHTNAVQRVRFANRNRQLVTSGADGLVKVWTVADSECTTLDNHANRIWALDVRDDGRELVTADADGYISLWTDNSEEVAAERERQQREKIESEQQLSNFVRNNDWSNAFLLALTLEHLMRLYNVVKGLIAEGKDDLAVGSAQLEATMRSLDTAQKAVLLKKVRDWNINFKQFEIAQKVLAVMVDSLDLENADVRRSVEQIVPYNERHIQRVDGLLEQTYVLDYVVHEMEKA